MADMTDKTHRRYSGPARDQPRNHSAHDPANDQSGSTRLNQTIFGYWPQPAAVSVGGAALAAAQVLANSGIIIAEEIKRALEAI